MPRLAFAAMLVLTGCTAYDPAVLGDRANVKFRADLMRCRTEASRAASHRANATPQSAFLSVFDSGEREHADVAACMEARGHAAKPGA